MSIVIFEFINQVLMALVQPRSGFPKVGHLLQRKGRD